MVTAALAGVALASAVAGGEACGDLLPRNSARAHPGATRTVEARDLVTLRDFGQLGAGSGDERLFAIAPDGRHVALHLRRADPGSNSYCLALVVLDLKTRHARIVDRGGELVRPSYAHSRKLAGFPMGVPAVITPAWSPDSRWIALLMRRDGVTQVWRVRADGGGSEQITREAQDVSAVTWSVDGRRIVFRTDRALSRARHAIEEEGRAGWHYDDRFQPTATPVPYPLPSDSAGQVFTLDLETGVVAEASSLDRETLAASLSASQSRVTDPAFPAPIFEKPGELAVHRSGNALRARVGIRDLTCRNDACASAVSFWVASDRRSVLLLARSGWGGGDLTFYRWSLEADRLTRLSTTSDLLLGCQPWRTQLLCAREGATRPRRLALVDPVTGRSKTIFNPNLDYDQLRTGSVERMRLRSQNGTGTFADVMLPPDFAPGRRYPMVVVSYESRGFLRGGTGDEYPVPAFASAGMIVLSFQRPRDVAATVSPPPASDDDFNRVNAQDWADRRNVNSALIDGVTQLLQRGVVDRSRIGITGLSDGLATAAFAMLNSPYFSAAALSGCCEEPVNTSVLQGPEFARMVTAAGYPPLTRPDARVWAPYSIAQNARGFVTPLLIQAPDREFVLSLPTVHALREAGAPVDLYVFPGEFHIKWQPAHRLAVYERALRWFEFWFDLPPLPGQVPPPDDEAQRWKSLREKQAAHLAEQVMTSSAPRPRHP